jgi:membrane protease YdiL (CAAX protease family)
MIFSTLPALLLLTVYILARFIFLEEWFSLPVYTSYILEAAFALLVTLIYRRDFKLEKARPPRFWILALAFLLAGALAAQFCPGPIPVNLSSLDVWFALLLIAPFLEEWVFRHVLWILFQRSFAPLQLAKPWVLVFLTALFFSLAHLVSIYFIPESFAPFIYFQTAYTFALGLLLGFYRSRSFLLSCLVFHFAFNLGFGLNAARIEDRLQREAEARGPRLLVADMAVDFKVLAEIYPQPLLGESLQGAEASQLQLHCAEHLKLLEDYLKGKELTLEQSDRVQEILQEVHGYHILGTVMQYAAPNTHFYYSAMRPHPLAKNLPELDVYIRDYIEADLAKLAQAVDKSKAQVVQIASSDSWEENYADFQAKGLTPKLAAMAADKIMEAWETEWSKILARFPQTLFVVSAGNGGVDGKGDMLGDEKKKRVFPASLPFENLVVVGSYGIGSGRTSLFSNFSPQSVDLLAPGEDIMGPSGCKALPQIALDGSSQASALVAAFLTHGLAQGKTLGEILAKLPQEKAWRGDSKEGRYLPVN